MPPEPLVSEPLILAFDTSAAHCAAVVLRGAQVLASRSEPMDKGQAERLMPLISELLAEAGIVAADLAAIGVGTGPGNFTGVRIAVSAARGLALALRVPAIGVTTFEAVALDGPRPMLVIEDARRGEVYVQHFGMAGPDAAGIAKAGEVVPAGCPVAGSGARLTDGAPIAARWPLSEAIARVALSRLGTPQPRPAPFYLRGADAAPPSDPPPVWLT